MSEELVVEFGPEDDDTCAVMVNRPVGSGGPQYFATIEEARANPLAARLIEIEGLEAVLFQERSVTLLKPIDGVPWDQLKAPIESALREYYEQADRRAESVKREMTDDEKAVFVRLQNTLNEEVNPMIASHGGFIEVLDYKEGTAFISMQGGCQGCGMASVTLREGVERSLRNRVPELQQILDTTDHAAGTNPYYAS